MAERLIRVCDHPEGEHDGEIKTYEVRLPSGLCVSMDLCRVHSAELEELTTHGRRKPGSKKKPTQSRKGFRVTPLDQIS